MTITHRITWTLPEETPTSQCAHDYGVTQLDCWEHPSAITYMHLAVRIVDEDGEEFWDEIDADSIVVEPGDDTDLESPAPFEAVEGRVLARHGLTRAQVEVVIP